MSRYLICQFSSDGPGRWNYQPPFGTPVSLDRSNDIEPVPGQKYLVEVIRELPGLRRFSVIIEAVLDLFQNIQPLLLEATWKRPEHVTGEPWVEVTHEKYGPIEAKLYRPTGGRYVKRSSVEIIFFTADGKQQSFTLEDGWQVSLGALERQVHACVGPAVNLAAAISRQAECRRVLR